MGVHHGYPRYGYPHYGYPYHFGYPRYLHRGRRDAEPEAEPSKKVTLVHHGYPRYGYPHYRYPYHYGYPRYLHRGRREAEPSTKVVYGHHGFYPYHRYSYIVPKVRTPAATKLVKHHFPYGYVH